MTKLNIKTLDLNRFKKVFKIFTSSGVQTKSSILVKRPSVFAELGKIIKINAEVQTSAKRLFAFTMAEVLITLGIIGIVASMTLPTLINNNRNKQLEAGLKRAYSLIGQALDMYQAEHGERIKEGEVGGLGLKGMILPYFKLARDCSMGYGTIGNSSVEKACIKNYRKADEEHTSSTLYKTYNGKANVELDYFDDGQFVLNDGSLILIENPNVARMYISVDVNGYNKNPNKLGHDLFMFQIDKKGTLLPMGIEGTVFYTANNDYCSPTSTHNMNGAGCTYKALSEKDYFKNLPR